MVVLNQHHHQPRPAITTPQTPCAQSLFPLKLVAATHHTYQSRDHSMRDHRHATVNHRRRLRQMLWKLWGVLEDYFFAEEPSFVKNAAGQIALERNFTRGRKSEQVHAACLYIAFRYVLGAVFLQLCQVLRLGEHPIVQKPVDPSLFIHRYTKSEFVKAGSKAVSDTALAIVASMKRDWMQTGRKPSGLCGAALYISALAHGIKCSKPDIVEELNTMAKEHEKNSMIMPGGGLKGFDKLSGGLGGGLDPPAFQRAERERFKKHFLRSVDEACAHEATKDGKYDDSHREDESETLSDIDDEEVDLYIHDEEGKHIKKLLWETANREYLENLQGLKSKVNFELLNELFDEMENTDDLKKPKKVRFDLPLDNDDNIPSKVEDKNEDEMGLADFDDEGDMGDLLARVGIGSLVVGETGIVVGSTSKA
ncbi:hypothetical protein JHK86_053204 [Glycine max]|nr:hypothetical protein JHK86_053204 [Glycine max]